MKRYLLAFISAAAFIQCSSCEGKTIQGSEVSTPETSAGITSEYSSHSVQAGTLTSVEITETLTYESAVSSETADTTTSTFVLTSTDSSTETTTTSSVKATSANKTASSSSASGTETTSASVQTTTTTAAESTQQTETTTRPVPLRENIISEYKKAITDKIELTLEGDPENAAVSYTLYDMDENGIPELIIKSGTCEADYQDTFYTYDEFGLKIISTGNPSGHTAFAHEPSAKKYVSAYSQMGNGLLKWLCYDGSDIVSQKKESFEYNSEEPFEANLEAFGVEYLPFVKFTHSSEELTWVYRVVSGGLEYDIISGLDFSFLDNYDFE